VAAVGRAALPLLACLLIALGAFTLGYAGNEDFGWYLASGDEILAHGAIPERDPFLYTSAERDTWVTSAAAQRTWVTHSWLWTVELAWLRGHFGLEGVAVASTLCAALLATLVYTRARLDRFGLVNGAVCALALAACLDRFTPRTDLASLLLWVVFLVLLERPGLGWPRVVLLCALQALWANLHGGFPLGIFAGAAYAAAEPRRRRLALVGLLALASLLPPSLGQERLAGAWAFVRQLTATGAGRAASPIAEWQPTFAAGLTAPALFWLAWLALGGAAFAAARPPLRLARVAVFAGTAVLALSASRFVPFFALTSAIVTLEQLSELRFALALPSRLRPLHALATAASGALLLAIAASLWISRAALDGGRGRTGFVALRPEFSAPGAAEYLRSAPGPIFNEIALGGDLIDALYPEHTLFIDTRNLSARVLAEYRRAMARPEAWHALAQRYGFRTAVLSNLSFAPSPLRRQLAHDPRWRLVFLDPQASVFERVEGAPAPRIEPTGRWGDAAPFLPPGGPGPQAWIGRYGRALLLETLRAYSDLDQLAALETVATLGLERLPGDAELLAHRGYARLRQGRTLEAADDYTAALQAAPENAGMRLNLARALARSGRGADALAQIDAVLARSPGNADARRLRARLAPSPRPAP
jgi:tetratricopeptide (TPR) repeat protein